MAQTLGGIGASRLERSCGRPPDSIRFGPTAHGIERAEVYLSTHFFERHRHDTYAIGITAAGVQTFHYRGTGRVCLPGQLHVLHPDEVHDGVQERMKASATGFFTSRLSSCATRWLAKRCPSSPIPSRR